jgi:hypothetical protein
MTDYWLSSRSMTVHVTVEGGYITRGPAIVRRFMGQPLANLTAWMERQGGLVVKEMP